MKKNSDKEKSKSFSVKSTIFIAGGFALGWLAIQPLKSHAAVSLTMGVIGVWYSIVQMIFGLFCLAAFAVFVLFILDSITLDEIIGFLRKKKGNTLKVLSRKKEPPKALEFDQKVEWQDINSWQGMPKEVAMAEKRISDHTKSKEVVKAKEKTKKPSQVARKGYPVLAFKKNIAMLYAKINDMEGIVASSGLGESEIDRARNLKNIADQILEGLQALYDLGQVDSPVLLQADSTGIRKNAGYSHAESAERKLKEVRVALDSIVVDAAAEISNTINSISLPKRSDLLLEFEYLKKEGERLLSIIKYEKTSVSDESIFVLKKITEERLDDLWKDYNSAKESVFEKEVDNSYLSGIGRKSKNPDHIISEVFSEIRAIYKDVEKSIKTRHENEAINKLLITKEYFNKR